jgi:hypothetical protein
LVSLEDSVFFPSSSFIVPSIINGFKVSNKREDLDLKIADRELLQQIGGNPFLSETNYVDDIAIRDNFLKPVNTTQGRTKNTNNENNNEHNY